MPMSKRAQSPVTEDLFATAFNASPIAIAISNLETGTIADANERFLTMFGGTREQIVGSSGSRLNLWVDRGERQRAYDAIRQGERYISGLTSFRRVDGETFPGIFTFDRIDIGGVLCSLIHIQDLSDLESLRADLAQGEARMSSLLLHSRDVIGILKLDHTTELISTNVAAFFGYELLTPEQLIDCEMHHPEDAARVSAEVEEALKQPGSVRRLEHRMRRGDGGWMWVESTLVNLTREPAIGGILYSVHDIEARRRSEEALRLRSLLLDEAPAAIFAITGDGVITHWNAQAQAILGWSRDDAIGARLSDFSGESGFHVLARRMLDNALIGLRWEGEAQLAGRDGSVIDIQATSTPMPAYSDRGPGMVAVIVDITDRKRAEADLERLAVTDALTGLANRNRLVKRLQVALSSLQDDQSTAVFFINLDQVRALNESLGHEHGDLALQGAARRLEAMVGEDGFVARFSGDTFAVVIDNCSAEEAEAFAARLHAGLQAPLEIYGRDRFIGPNLGYTVAGPGTSVSAVLSEADTARREARQRRPSEPVVFRAEMAERAQHRLDLETDLRQAIVDEQFLLHYQPIVSLSARTIVASEALIRWRRPDGSIVLPGEFIPLAEETGLVIPIGEWVLEEICRALRRWDDRLDDRPAPGVHVNISVDQFRQPDFAETVMATLQRFAIEPSRITLEVTETMAMTDVEQAIRQSRALRAIGVRLAMDDFGAGYSNLGLLNKLPVQMLKIDRSFARELENEPGIGVITRSLVAIGSDLGMTVTGEGIETAEQADRLAGYGATRGQGYFFAQPMPEEEFVKLLELGPSARLPR